MFKRLLSIPQSSLICIHAWTDLYCDKKMKIHYKGQMTFLSANSFIKHATIHLQRQGRVEGEGVSPGGVIRKQVGEGDPIYDYSLFMKGGGGLI